MNEAAAATAASGAVSPIAILLILVAIAALLVWLIVEHKITLPAKFASLESKLGLVHAAAVAPVSVAIIPTTTASSQPASAGPGTVKADPPAAAAPAAAAAAPAAPGPFAGTLPRPDTSGMMPWQQPAIVYDAAVDGAFASFRSTHGMYRNYVSPAGVALDGAGRPVTMPDYSALLPVAFGQAAGAHTPQLSVGASFDFVAVAGKFNLVSGNAHGGASGCTITQGGAVAVTWNEGQINQPFTLAAGPATLTITGSGAGDINYALQQA